MSKHVASYCKAHTASMTVLTFNNGAFKILFVVYIYIYIYIYIIIYISVVLFMT